MRRDELGDLTVFLAVAEERSFTGPLVFNSVPMVLKAVTDGFGLACLMEDHVTRLVAKGTFVRVLEDWCPPFPGYHLYYPSRRQSSPAVTLLAEILRYRTA